MSSRSLQVPGSLSSAFTTMYFGLGDVRGTKLHFMPAGNPAPRSEEHTSELQSPCNLVCRPLLEKKIRRTGPAAHPSCLSCGAPDSRTPPRHVYSSRSRGVAAPPSDRSGGFLFF